VEEGKETAL